MKKKAFVVIPTYNEKDGVAKLIPQIFDIAEKIDNWDIHVLVADDTSPDGTYKVVQEFQRQNRYKKNLHLKLNKEKVGIGGAYINAFKYAIEEFNPYVLFEMDGDGQHTPTLIPAFLKKIEGGADFVIGSRYVKEGSIPKEWSIDRKAYSFIGNLVAQLGFMNFKAKDWTSGYRCIKSWLLNEIVDDMRGLNGYVFQIALLDKAFKKHAKVDEVPLNFANREEGDSKFNTIQYIRDALTYIMLHSTFVRFAIVGFLGFGVDFGSAFGFIELLHLSKPLSNGLSAEIAIVFNFFMNNFWSFKHKKIEGRYLRKLIKFNLVSSGAILIQVAGMYTALMLLGDFDYHLPFFVDIPSWIVYKVLIIGFFIIPYSYFMYNKVIWKSPKK